MQIIDSANIDEIKMAFSLEADYKLFEAEK